MKHKEEKICRRAILKGSGAALAVSALCACGTSLSFVPKPIATETPSETPSLPPETTAEPQQPVMVDKTEYRAMWISYLEWKRMDFSSEQAFTQALAQMFDNCLVLQLNTVIVQVRPFGDAMYHSTLYPWSHFITGTQGQAPAFDPFEIMIAQAHARALSIEAWINPYRLRLNHEMPETLAQTNLAYTKPEWVVEVGEGLYLNPALPEVAAYVCEGVREILEQYPVDAIHFDDYFYPTTEPYVDETEFAVSGAQNLDAWRRENVTALVKQVYKTVKSFDETLRFGISPQGNPDNNLSQQYSDVSAWMNPAQGERCVDYVCPQVYWGYQFTLQSGSERFAFENITKEWFAMPRSTEIDLYFGLGAWRIGDGDGSANEETLTHWNSGNALADMIADLRAQDMDGYSLYRYDSLYASAHAALAQQECDAIAQENAKMTAV